MKIMAITDHIFAGTGFSEELRHILMRLAQLGHDISWVGMAYMGYPINIPDAIFPDIPTKGAKIKLLGSWGNPKTYGAQALERYYHIYNPDIVLLMGDPKHVYPYGRLKKHLKFPLMFYVTLDGLPVLPQWGEILRIPDINIAMTEWAFNEYHAANMPVHAYIHHGINWQYWQMSKQEKMKIRRKYGIRDDETIFINWDVNQYRKRPDALLRCWRDFNPTAKKAKLILFTDWYCKLGYNLEERILAYNVPRETIISPKELIGREKIWECAEEPWLIREIAALGDIYLSTSSGEGFGRCNLEAMTMGMTVIATNYSAIPEVLDKYGVLVPCYQGRAGRYDLHDRCRSVSGGVVDEKKFVEAMLYYYQNPKEREELGIRAKEWARMYDYDNYIMVGWNKILSSFNPDVLMAHQLLGL